LLSAFFGFWLATKLVVPPLSTPAAALPISSANLATQQPPGFSPANPITNNPTATIQAPTPTVQSVMRHQPLPLLDDRIDFSTNGGQIDLQIDPPNPVVNHGKPIELSFLPDNTCVFGDHQACVTPIEAARDQYNHYFLSIHSGVGGEGQSFRHALEGTGINRAGYSLDKVNQHIKALQGAQVTIRQDGDEVGGFFLAGLIRIPPAYLEIYLKQPVTQAVQFATSLDPAWTQAIDFHRPMLIFETCGWKMPAESWYPGVTSTTGSIYLAVIQPLP
jgi:hypothetical protein